MSLLNLGKLTAGLSPAWAGLLTDWDRSLRAGNHPETTRYNYLLAASQLVATSERQALPGPPSPSAPPADPPNPRGPIR